VKAEGTVVISKAEGGSVNDQGRAVTELAQQYTTVDLLHAIDALNFDTTVALTAVAEQLGRRKQDIDDLLSVTKSAQELSRKVKRLAERLLDGQ
jgi:hypothetical protein